MLKSEFEKRHGRIYAYKDAIVDGYISPLAKKYDLMNDDQPAPVWHVVKNMPDSHFGHLNLESIQEIFNHLENIKSKELRNYYLGVLDHRFFSNGWGWFSRGGHGLSTSPRSISEIPKSERETAVRVLRCLKRGFSKYNYHPIHGKKEIIDTLIKRYGGTTDKLSSLRAAKARVDAASKLPRKLKKRVKNGFFDKLFVKESKEK